MTESTGDTSGGGGSKEGGKGGGTTGEEGRGGGRRTEQRPPVKEIKESVAVPKKREGISEDRPKAPAQPQQPQAVAPKSPLPKSNVTPAAQVPPVFQQPQAPNVVPLQTVPAGPIRQVPVDASHGKKLPNQDFSPRQPMVFLGPSSVAMKNPGVQVRVKHKSKAKKGRVSYEEVPTKSGQKKTEKIEKSLLSTEGIKKNFPETETLDTSLLNDPKSHGKLITALEMLVTLGVESLVIPQLGSAALILDLCEAAKIAGIANIILDTNNLRLIEEAGQSMLKRLDWLIKATPGELLKNFNQNQQELGSPPPPSFTPNQTPTVSTTRPH